MNFYCDLSGILRGKLVRLFNKDAKIYVNNKKALQNSSYKKHTYSITITYKIMLPCCIYGEIYSYKLHLYYTYVMYI